MNKVHLNGIVAEALDDAYGKATMKTYTVEGIGSLDLSQRAHGLASLFKVLRIVSFVVFAPLAFAAWAYARNNAAAPYSVSIPGLVSLVAAFVFWSLEVLVIHRLYTPGDLYKLLEDSVRARKTDYGRSAAERILKLDASDLLTCKLKARAHEFMALNLSGDKGAAHRERSLALLTEVIKQEPGNVAFRLDRARSYQLSQRYDDALEDIEVVINSSDPPALKAYSMKISCLASLNKKDEALEACDQLEKNLPRFPNKDEATEGLLAHRTQLN